MIKPRLGYSELHGNDQASQAFNNYNQLLAHPEQLTRTITAMTTGEPLADDELDIVSAVESVLDTTDNGASLDFTSDADRAWGEVFNTPEHQEARRAYMQADTQLRQALLERDRLEASGYTDDDTTVEILRLTTEIEQLAVDVTDRKRLRGLRALGAIAQLHIPKQDTPVASQTRILVGSRN